MTPEEREVVEAAKAWRGLTHGNDEKEEFRLCRAVDALTKPEPGLVERLRMMQQQVIETWPPGIVGVSSILAEAADELERRGAK